MKLMPVKLYNRKNAAEINIEKIHVIEDKETFVRVWLGSMEDSFFDIEADFFDFVVEVERLS